MDWSKITKVLGRIYGIIGVIVSFVLALNNSQERDLVYSIAIFFGCLLSVVVVCSILFSISYIAESINEIKLKVGQTSTISNSVSKGTNTADSWKCKKCNKVNMSYVGTCSCGQDRNDN